MMTSADRVLRDFAEPYLRRRYSILFYTLLLTMVAAPVLNALKLSGILFELLVAACLLAAVIPADAVRSRPFLLVLMIVVWLARPLTDWLGHRLLSVMTLGISTLAGFLAAVAALRFAMGAKKVGGAHLYAGFM